MKGVGLGITYILKISVREDFILLLTLYVFTFCISMCFSVLNCQTRHQNGDTHFLTLDEILDETKLLDISMKQKQWLMTEVCLCFFSIIQSSVYHQEYTCPYPIPLQ